jgi:hypothetical protein
MCHCSRMAHKSADHRVERGTAEAGCQIRNAVSFGCPAWGFKPGKVIGAKCYRKAQKSCSLSSR